MPAKKLPKDYYLIDPSDLDNSLRDIPPGSYAFVQDKNKNIYIRKIIEYETAHYYIPKLVRMTVGNLYPHNKNKNKTKSELYSQDEVMDVGELYSAGEIIIGPNKNIVAWCLKTGSFYNILNLEKLSKKDITQQFGLPSSCYYDVGLWETFTGKPGVKSGFIKDIFKPNGDFISTPAARNFPKELQENKLFKAIEQAHAIVVAKNIISHAVANKNKVVPFPYTGIGFFPPKQDKQTEQKPESKSWKSIFKRFGK